MKITGVIAPGKQLGRTLGFPTANLQPDPGCVLPEQNGVYCAVIAVDGGAPMPCVLNQGSHPTAPGGPPTIEAHILDFSGDIYGLPAEIEYLHYLRPECKFPSLDALRAQLSQDVKAARAFFRPCV